MSFQSYLETLRAKPEHIRRRYAFWSSFGITAIIFAFWLGSFSSLGTSSKQAVARAVDRAGSPAQSLVAAVGDFAVDLKDLIFGPRQVKYSSVEVRPGK